MMTFLKAVLKKPQTAVLEYKEPKVCESEREKQQPVKFETLYNVDFLKAPFYQGKMSTVWIGHRQADGMPICVKQLKQNAKDMQHEIKVMIKLKRIKCPHVLHYLDIFKSDTAAWIVTPQMSKDLLEYLNNCSKPLTQSQLLKIAHQLATALHCLHSNGIVHLDVKPDNVLIDSSGNVVLSDFGLSESYDRKVRGKMKLWKGSLAYVSPEIAHLSEYDPEKSDVWSLGVLLYMCVKREMLFEDQPLSSLAKKMREMDIPLFLASQIQDSVLCLLVQSMLCFHERDRPDFKEILIFLERLASKNYDFLF